jgi:two-component system cell cycle response regulator
MKKKIYVIDDDPLALRMITEALHAEGYGVSAFSEFDELAEALREDRPDLVMTDVVMPKVSGFEVCSKVKEMTQPDSLPVIVMTGKLDAIDPVQARRRGADDFVVKTADMAVLTQAVRKMLEK